MHYPCIVSVFLLFLAGIEGGYSTLTVSGRLAQSNEEAHLIARARDIIPERFPYMCSLKRTRDEEHVCAGVLIKEDWVLTAAHCVHSKSENAESSPLIHVGAFLMNDSNAETVSSDKTIVHCGWTGDPLLGGDIALLKLKEKSKNPFVRLPSENSRKSPGNIYQAIRWGKMGDGEGHANKLRLLLSDLEHLPTEVCNEFESFENKIDERVICASSPTADACSCASGGALLEANKIANIAEGDPNRDLLVGIRSHGAKSCRTSNIPGVYTSVAEYRSWIDKVIDSNGGWNCDLVNKDSCADERTVTMHHAAEQSTPTLVAKISSESSSVEMEIKAKLPQCGLLDVGEEEDDSIFDVVSLGGQFSSRPSCLSTQPRRIDCFIRKLDSNFFHTAKQDEEIIALDTFGAPSVGSPILGAPECVSLGKDHMDCFMIGRAGPRMWNHPWSAASGFPGWVDQGRTVMDTPSCVTRYENTIECFVRAMDMTPHLKKYVPSTGNVEPHYVKLPDIRFLVPSSCGSWGGDIIDCIGVSYEFLVYHNRYVEGSGFGKAWTPLQEYSSLRPTVINPSESTVAVFIVKVSGQMAHATFDGTSWSAWKIIPGVIRSSPECIATSPTRFHCFAIGPDSTMLHTAYDGKIWTAWKSSRHQFMDKPSCIHYAVKQIRCYARDERSALAEIVYEI